MLRHMCAMLLALACAGCATLPRVSITLPEPAATLTASASPALVNQDPGGNGMTQTTQMRGQFELVGGQGRVINGFVRISALVRNRSAEWADVVVAVELLDASGQALVNRAATNAGEQLRSPYAIPPGGAMYYLYLRDVERLNGDYASQRLTLSQAYAAAPVVRAQVSLSSQTALKPAFDGAPAYLARAPSHRRRAAPSRWWWRRASTPRGTCWTSPRRCCIRSPDCGSSGPT